MKKINILSLVIILVMIFTSCVANGSFESTESGDITSPETDIIKGEEYTLPLEDGYNQVILDVWRYVRKM